MEEPVEPPLPVASPDAALVTAERRNTNTNTNNSLLSLGSAVPSPMPVSSPSSSRLAYDFYVRSPQSDILNASHNNNDNDSIHNSNNSGGGGTTTTTSLNLQLPPDLMNDDFAQVIRERTRQRRLQDDASVANLRVQVSRLEAALGVACRRRVDAVTAIQSQAAAAVQALEERLSTQVAADVSRVADRLTRLEQRMTGLETQWRDNVGSIQDSVQHSTVKLQSQLQSLQQAVAQERTGATQRLDRLSQQMQTTAQDYDDRWQHERQERIAAVATLHDTMQAVHSVRELNVSQVERELTNELRSLQTALAQERHERQTYDDELRSVVNRYSKNIQESLAATTLLSSSSSELRTLASPHGGGSGGRIHDNPYYHRGA